MKGVAEYVHICVTLSDYNKKMSEVLPDSRMTWSGTLHHLRV